MKPIQSFAPSANVTSGTIETNGINKNEQLVLYNDSVFGLQLSFVDGSQDVIPPGWAKDWILENEAMGKVQWKVLNQLVGTNYPIIQVYGAIYEPGEHTARVNTSMERGPAVTPTASGDPIFTATVGFGNTASLKQLLNIFNPANSGIIYTFHSARCFTNDNTIPTVNLAIISGADSNLTNSVPIVSHDGSANPRVSSAHATSVDQAGGIIGSNPIIEVMNMQQNVTQDMLAFPDYVTLAPGDNLLMELSAGAGGHVVRLTMKWSEHIIVPGLSPQVSSSSILANVLTAQNLANIGLPVGSTLINSIPQGQSSPAIFATNDGTITLSVLVAGVLHQLLKGKNLANFLQLGQVGDIAEFLGDVLVDGTLQTPNAVNINEVGVDFNATSGGVGRATAYQPLAGIGLNLFMVKLNANFKNGSSVLNVTIPTPFTKFALFAFVDFQGFALANLGSTITGSYISVWDNPSTIVTGNTNFGELGNLACTGSAFDTVQISASNANNKNG